MKHLFFVLFIYSSLQAATAFENALDIYKKGDYTNSFKTFKALAEKEDDADAAYYVAYMYENGLGYTQKSFRQSYYNLELFVTIPTALSSDAKFIKSLKLGLAHQSNGKGGTNQHSWNYSDTIVSTQYNKKFTESVEFSLPREYSR